MRPIENRVIVLITHEDKVYYCDKHFIAASNFDGKLPQGFTMYRIKSFDATTGTLLIRFEGSRPLSKDDYLLNSEANAELFDRVEIKWIKIQGQNRTVYTPTVNKTVVQSRKDARISTEADMSFFVRKEPDVEIEKSEEFTVTIPVMDLTFGAGTISFLAYSKQVFQHIRFEITNLFVKPEFNSIKKYFAKQYEKGKATALCQVKYKGSTVLESQVISHNFDSVNSEVISTVVDDLINDYIIDFESEEIRSLEESLEGVYEIPEENIEQWLMSKLSKESLTKHHEHLMYLSGLHERGLFPLKVTGKPISFIFGIPKETYVFIIWETHNTKEATYLWRLQVSRTLEEHFIKEMEDIVKKLRQGNKRSYRAANKDNGDFRVIEHDYNLPDNGFEKWRIAVDEFVNG